MNPPVRIPMEYSSFRPVAGLGPFGLARDPWPLPLTASRASPTGSTLDAYQPVGMRPAILSSPRALDTPDVDAERSNTAIAFASASATSRRAPSAESAMALGVEPSFGPAGGGSSRRATICRD